MRNTLTSLKDAALDLLFPAQCVVCQREGGLLCVQCAAGLRPVVPACVVCRKLVPPRNGITAGRTCRPCRKRSSIFAFLSPFPYEEPAIRELIHNLKYRRERAAAPILADLVADSIRRFNVSLPTHAAVIPIPLHRSRERVRGFNQSGLIAEAFCAKLGLAYMPNILKKIKNTAPQMELSGDKRKTNLIGVFAVTNHAEVKNKTILLIDDVKTTGATLNEAAKTLRSAGAKQIWAITVAR